MARVAFFAERLPPDADPIATFSFELMRALAEQQHDVRVFSTFREGAEMPPSHPRLEILRPFRKWSWLELPRLIPLVLEFQPQIIHIIQPRAEAIAGFTNAMSALPSLAPLAGRASVITSFYDLHEKNVQSHRMLFSTSDLVTVTNEPQRDLVSNFTAKFKRQPITEILPVPGFTLSSETTALVTDDEIIQADPAENIRSFLDQHQELIFVPGDIDLHRAPETLFETLATLLEAFPKTGILFGGGWGSIRSLKRRELMSILERRHLGSRVLLSGPLSNETELLCLRHARIVFTASLPPESLGLMRTLRGAIAVAAVPVLSPDQADLDSLPWQDRRHAFITGAAPHSWGEALSDALGSSELLESIRRTLPEFARHQALDQPGNVMSRLYARLLDQKRG